VTWRDKVRLSTTHAALIKQIEQYLQLTGWMVQVFPRGGVPGLAGLQDMQAFKAGRALFIEVKAGRDKVRYEQSIVAAELMAAGFAMLEARSLDDVMRVAAKS
jgi:hypothetical protein